MGGYFIPWIEVKIMQMIPRRSAAVAFLQGSREHSGITGEVRFYQFPGAILVEADVLGLPNNGSGFFGFHIHEGADCGGTDFSATGGHYGGKVTNHPRHAGDLPPLLSRGGRAYLAVMTDRFSIRDILGRTVVIHGSPDDFKTQPSGDSGRKIACGSIQSTARRKM